MLLFAALFGALALIAATIAVGSAVRDTSAIAACLALTALCLGSLVAGLRAKP